MEAIPKVQRFFKLHAWVLTIVQINEIFLQTLKEVLKNEIATKWMNDVQE
jgi:hypothetical protein